MRCSCLELCDDCAQIVLEDGNQTVLWEVRRVRVARESEHDKRKTIGNEFEI